MGQKLGKAAYVPAAFPFLNLSSRALEILWAAFNDIADGFGLNLRDVQAILQQLESELGEPKARLASLAAALFAVLDSDNNGLIDAIEMLSALAASSGMTSASTLEFIFSCYDFDGGHMLTVDEIALALTAALAGSCKLVNEEPPLDSDVEEFAMDTYTAAAAVAGSCATPSGRVRMADVVSHCCAHAEARCWLHYFAEPSADEATSGTAAAAAGAAAGTTGTPATAGAAAAQRSELRNQQQLLGLDASASLHTRVRSWRERLALQGDTAAVTAPPLPAQEPPWVDTVRSLVPKEAAAGGARPGAVPATPAATVHAELQWVHGYSGRGPLQCSAAAAARYDAAGRAVYCAGRLGVRLSAAEHQQAWFAGHSDDITALAMHPSGTLVATGQAGSSPTVMIWDTDTMHTVAVLRQVHSSAVTQLTFSIDGAKLASVSSTVLAVHDWASGKLLSVSSLTRHNSSSYSAAAQLRSPVLALCFTSEGTVVTCSEGGVSFWQEEAPCGRLRRKRGVPGRKAGGSALTPLCCAAVGGGGRGVVTGTSDGRLLAWAGRNCAAAVRGAHSGAVLCVAATSHGCVTGGADSKVRLWTALLEPGGTFDAAALGPAPAVRSVCLSADGSRILLGTAGCELYELSALDGSVTGGGTALVSGHGGSCISGSYSSDSCSSSSCDTALAVHPARAEYATGGADGAVRVWDALTKSCLRTVQLDTAVTCLDFSPDGVQIIAGLGGSGPKAGGFVVMRYGDFAVQYEGRDSRSAAVDVRWSPDGETVALGCADAVLYLYGATDNKFDLVAAAHGHSGAISMGIDFDRKSDWLRSGCEGGALLFWGASKGDAQDSAARFKDTAWATSTCAYIYGTACAHAAAAADGAAVTCTDVSSTVLLASTSSAAALSATAATAAVQAAGDSYGRIRLFANKSDAPADAVATSPLYQELTGHAGPVGRVRFLASESGGTGQGILVTVGAHDGCTLQWAVNKGEDRLHDAAAGAAAVDAEALSRAPEHEAHAQDPVTGASLALVLATSASDVDAAEAVPRPWETVALPPTRPPPVRASLPSEQLRVQRLRGYGSARCSSARYAGSSSSGSGSRVAYSAGKWGVVVDAVTGAQTLQGEHSGEVTCLAVSHDGTLVATGEQSGYPVVLVWAANSGHVVARLHGHHTKAVFAVAFCPDGRRIAAVGCSTSARCLTTAVYDYSSSSSSAAVLLSTAQYGSPCRALSAAWSADGAALCVCGEGGGITFYATAAAAEGCAGRGLVTGQGGMGNGAAVAQTFHCCAYAGSTAVVGTADGHLYVFASGSVVVTRLIKAHTGPVLSLSYSVTAGWVSGGRDGNVRLYDTDLVVLSDFDVRQCLGGLYASNSSSSSDAAAVCSVCASPKGTLLLVGTQGGDLVEIAVGAVAGATSNTNSATEIEDPESTGNSSGDLPNAPKKVLRHVASGHAVGPVWALSAHPSGHSYVTAGDDGSVRIWSMESFSQSVPQKTVLLDVSARAVQYSPDGNSIAVGCGGGGGRGDAVKGGTLLVLSAATLAVEHEATDASEWITDVAYSSDGSILAVASHDSKVYLYATAHGYSKLATITTHKAPVLRLDFSANGAYLQSADAAGALHWTDVATDVDIPNPAAIRDVPWATWSSPIGWPVAGAHRAAFGCSAANGGSLVRIRSDTPLCLEAGPRPSLSRSASSRDATSATDTDSETAVVVLNGTNGKTEGYPPTSTEACHLTVTGDEYGVVRVYPFPVPHAAAAAVDSAPMCRRYSGHTGPVLNARWVSSSSVVTTGNDGCIVEWQLVTGSAPNAAGVTTDVTAVQTNGSSHVSHDQSSDTPQQQHAWLDHIAPPAKVNRSADGTAPAVTMQLEAAHGSNAAGPTSALCYNKQGDVLFAAAAAVTILYPRSSTQCFHTGHIHPVTAVTASNCGMFGASGDSPLVQVLEDRSLPCVRVWEACTGTLLRAFPTCSLGGTAALSFSSDGKWLAAGCSDSSRMIALYHSPSGQWHDGYPCKSAVTPHTGAILCMQFIGERDFPLVISQAPAALTLLHKDLCTTDCQLPITVSPAPPLSPFLSLTPCYYSSDSVQQFAGSTRFVGGTASGHLVLWAHDRAIACAGAHEGAVVSVLTLSATAAAAAAAAAAAGGASGHRKPAYASAGADGAIAVWGEGLERIRRFAPRVTVTRTAASGNGSDSFSSSGLLALAQEQGGAVFTAALQGGGLLEVSPQSGRAQHVADGLAGGGGASQQQQPLHFCNALAAHPSDGDVYATASGTVDATLRLWSVRTQRCTAVTRLPLDAPCGALVFEPAAISGGRLVVGLGAPSNYGGAPGGRQGVLVLLHAQTLQVVTEVRCSKSGVSAMRYSHDGTLLAVACTDGDVHILRADAKQYTAVLTAAATTGRSEGVTSLDWSIDGQLIRMGTAAGGWAVINAADGTAVGTKSRQVCDAVWASHYVPAGWSVQGVCGTQQQDDDSSSSSNNTTVASVAPRHAPCCLSVARMPLAAVAFYGASDMLAAGYDDGQIRILRYPAQALQVGAVAAAGGAGAVTAMCWTADGRALLSLCSGSGSGVVLQHALLPVE